MDEKQYIIHIYGWKVIDFKCYYFIFHDNYVIGLHPVFHETMEVSKFLLWKLFTNSKSIAGWPKLLSNSQNVHEKIVTISEQENV